MTLFQLISKSKQKRDQLRRRKRSHLSAPRRLLHWVDDALSSKRLVTMDNTGITAILVVLYGKKVAVRYVRWCATRDTMYHIPAIARSFVTVLQKTGQLLLTTVFHADA